MYYSIISIRLINNLIIFFLPIRSLKYIFFRERRKQQLVKLGRLQEVKTSDSEKEKKVTGFSSDEDKDIWEANKEQKDKPPAEKPKPNLALVSNLLKVTFVS